MAALYCLFSRLLRPFRLSGFLVAWCAFWACLAASMPVRAEGLPPGVLDLGTDPNTGIRRFKVGLGDVFGILGTPRYPSEAARQYLAETGEPLTVTVIQAQNPDRVLLSCFNEKKTRIERLSVKPGDYGPWESCPPDRRHLTPSGGAIISLQMKKVPSPDRVKEIGNAAFAAFAANNPIAFAAVLLAQEEWYGKGSQVAAAFNGTAVKELAAARAEIATLSTSFVAEQARANAAEDALGKANSEIAALKGRFIRDGAVLAAFLALAAAVLVLRARSRRRRLAQERADLESSHQEALAAEKAQSAQVLGRESALLSEATEIEGVLRGIFAQRSGMVADPSAVGRVRVLGESLALAEQREVSALGELALERDRVKALEKARASARVDVRRLVAMVADSRGALASLVASLADLRAMADPALLAASRGENSSLPPASLPEPPSPETAQELYRAVLGRVPTVREAIRRFNATLGTVLAELPAGEAPASGSRDPEILAELRKLEDRQVDPNDDYQGIIRMLYEAKGAVREMQRLEQQFRPVVEAWLREDARLNGTPLPLSNGWNRPWAELVSDLGPPIERLMRMQTRLDELERTVGRGAIQVPPPRPSHQTDVAELSAQGIFDRILRDGARLLDTLNREPMTVCMVRDRGDVGPLADLALSRRYRLRETEPSTLLELLGFSGVGLGRSASASAMAE